MEKRYKPKEVELRLIKKWKELGIYVYNSENNAPVYSVDTPPPYISADHLHLGHAMSYIQAEIIVRYNRMLGRNIFYPMGFDDNGLPTERFIEKKYKINKDKISKTEFINLCIEETERGSRTYKRIWDRLGIGVDWLLKYNTIGEFPREIAQKSFLDLYKKQLVYSEEAPIFWCTTCKTALAQADLEDKKEESKMYYVKFFLPSDDYLIIATSRPEMIPACVAIYVNPEDDRFKEFIGSEISTPIFNSKVPIFASEEVDIQLGTGAMMVCTWGDAGDVEKWKMDKLETKILVNKVGRLTEIAGEFQGLKLKEARKAIVQKLEEEGSLDKKENLEHIVNIH